MLRTALQNACRARRKARHRCCPRATTTYDGTPAPLACGPWPSSRCPKPHSVCALNTCVGVLRGFLHRGLCDTCPQVGGRSSLGGVPGSYLTTLNRSGPSLWSHTHGFTTLFPKAHVVPNPHGCESGVYDFICGFTTLITRNTWRGMCSGSSALPRRQANQPCLQRGMRCRGQSRHQPRISMEPMVASPFVHASAFLLFFKQSKSCLRAWML